VRRTLADPKSEALIENFADKITKQLWGCLLNPLKTTIVQHQRSMMTWVVRKNAASGKR
jgi:hypothetical protein